MSLNYRDGRLFLGESGDLFEIFQKEQGHPCYVYDLKNVEKRVEWLKSSLSQL